MGHELTHQEGRDLHVFKYFMRYMKFFAHVNEVHADFGATQKMCNSSRESLLRSHRYKMEYNRQINSPYITKSSNDHPSWEKRLFYTENFDFNRDLILQIAKDTGCKNQAVIDEVCDHFEEIKLS